MKDSEYVAMAFSFDNSMGDDLVFVCTQTSDQVSTDITTSKHINMGSSYYLQ